MSNDNPYASDIMQGKELIREEKVKKVIEKVCHSLGKPDFNGENHIINVDGMHWKELAEKFEKALNLGNKE